MTRNQIEIKYDEFFGTGLWERDYKSHGVIFAEQCLMDQEQSKAKDDLIEIYERDLKDAALKIKELEEELKKKS